MKTNYYYNYEKLKKDSFVNQFKNCICKDINKHSEIVFLCVGTDRLIGDSFGPLVGSRLKERLKDFNTLEVNVYGTLEENISYTNINEVIDTINKNHSNSYIITIDAALSEKNNIGNIYVKNEKLIIARSLSKSKIEIGDISIKAVVGKNYKLPNYNYFSLQNNSLNKIIKLANIVSDGIIEVIKCI